MRKKLTIVIRTVILILLLGACSNLSNANSKMKLEDATIPAESETVAEVKDESSKMVVKDVEVSNNSNNGETEGESGTDYQIVPLGADINLDFVKTLKPKNLR